MFLTIKVFTLNNEKKQKKEHVLWKCVENHTECSSAQGHISKGFLIAYLQVCLGRSLFDLKTM